MKENVKFDVFVIECNADTFALTYEKFIVCVDVDVFGSCTFTLDAPVEVFNEIRDHTEDGIEIVGVYADGGYVFVEEMPF